MIRSLPAAFVFAAVTASAGAACSNAGDAEVDASPLPADAALDDGGGNPDGGALLTLVVNEVAASGDPEDWLEVINATQQPLALGEFVYVDVAGDLEKARPFPTMTLAPGERHVQEISDAGSGFKLASDEEVWVYRAADGRLSDGVDWAEGDSPGGGSFARVPDAFGSFVSVDPDTRGAPNQ
jgi:hypothetical protein